MNIETAPSQFIHDFRYRAAVFLIHAEKRMLFHFFMFAVRNGRKNAFYFAPMQNSGFFILFQGL